MAAEAVTTFDGLFDLINESGEAIWDAVEQTDCDTLTDEMLRSTFEELDVLATHQTIEYVQFESIEIVSLDEKALYVGATGHVSRFFQYGSNSDADNEIGAVVISQNRQYNGSAMGPKWPKPTASFQEYRF
jgi:hypothetical protein